MNTFLCALCGLQATYVENLAPYRPFCNQVCQKLELIAAKKRPFNAISNDELVDILYELPLESLQLVCQTDLRFSHLCGDPLFRIQYVKRNSADMIARLRNLSIQTPNYQEFLNGWLEPLVLSDLVSNVKEAYRWVANQNRTDLLQYLLVRVPSSVMLKEAAIGAGYGGHIAAIQMIFNALEEFERHILIHAMVQMVIEGHLNALTFTLNLYVPPFQDLIQMMHITRQHLNVNMFVILYENCFDIVGRRQELRRFVTRSANQTNWNAIQTLLNRLPGDFPTIVVEAAKIAAQNANYVILDNLMQVSHDPQALLKTIVVEAAEADTENVVKWAIERGDANLVPVAKRAAEIAGAQRILNYLGNL